MERLRQDPPRPTGQTPGHIALPPPATDVARAAADALGDVTPVPGTVTIRVKTGGGRSAEIVATPDTTVGEVMDRVSADLGVEDAARYALVAQGEVLGDPRQSIETLAREHLGEELVMRLVRKPEAGGMGACPS
jgi:hypothetical protein